MRASAKKRSSNCCRWSGRTEKARLIVLRATRRSRPGSWASYTTPMDPRPISRRISYRPIVRGESAKGGVTRERLRVRFRASS